MIPLFLSQVVAQDEVAGGFTPDTDIFGVIGQYPRQSTQVVVILADFSL